MSEEDGTPAPGDKATETWSEAAFRADLAEALRKIDALPDLADAPRDDEGRILRKLEALGRLLGSHERPFGGTLGFYHLLPHAHRLIGHRRAKSTEATKQAVRAIAAAHAGPDMPPRHRPERPIDLALDSYETLVRARGYGPPRIRGSLTRLDLVATAEEVGVAPEELTEIAVRRIKHINRLAGRPGLIRGAEEGTMVDTKERPAWSEESFRADLDRECKKIDELAEFEGHPRNAEKRVLRKLEALGGVLRQHGRPLSGARTYVREVPYTLSLIRHAGAKATARTREAVKALVADHAGETRKLRHNPERPVDLALDRYEALVVERGWGTPRAHGSLTRIDKAATAEEAGVPLEDLGAVAMQRLQHINSLVDRPGPLKGIEENAKHNLVNPVAAMLLRKGCARYATGFPEDPLRPGTPDLITIARDCGIGMKDLRFSRENQRLIEEIRGDKPLVPNPVLNERRYTYADLIDTGEQLRSAEVGKKASAATLVRRTVKSLQSLLGLKGFEARLSDEVPRDLAARIRRAVAAGPSRFGSHWKRDMERWIKYDRAHRADLPLPDDFALALRVLLAENGQPTSKVAVAAKVSKANLQAWSAGYATPSHNQQEALERVAALLGVSAERLATPLSADWRLRINMIDHPDFVPEIARYMPDGFADLDFDAQTKMIARVKRTHLGQNTASARRGIAQAQDRYRLKFDKWPDSMKAAWAQQYPAPTDSEQKWSMRVPGEEVSDDGEDEDLSASDRPLRPGTVTLHLKMMESLLGYLVRPRKLTKQQRQQAAMLDQSMTTDFRPRSGLGIPIEYIHPAILAVPDLISSFIWWRCHRSGMQTRLVLSMLNMPSRFLRPDTGVVWATDSIDALERFKEWWDNNPHDLSEGRLKLDLTTYRKNWKKAVKRAFRTLAKDHKKVRKGKLPSSRDPFLPINSVLKADAPMEAYMAGVHNMLASRPAKIINQHIHLRDAILVLILLQTGLRASTLLLELDDEDEDERPMALSSREEQEREAQEIRIWKEVAKDKTVSWKIRIAPGKFKNYFSSFFQGGRPYEITLKDEEDLYEKLQRYVDYARPYMLRERKTKAFFVTQFGSDVTADEFRDIYRRITRYYFVERPALATDGEEDAERMGIPGMMIHGPHAVRHIIATHIVKSTGSLHMAAWAIQDTYQTVAKHYARFFPSDKVALATKALEDARAAARATAEAQREKALAARSGPVKLAA